MQEIVRRAVLVCALGSSAATAQVYNPASGRSPLALLEVPRDGLGYHATKTRAGALNEAGSWAEAEPLWEKLTSDYPRDPENWLGRAEAQEGLGKFADAIAARKVAGQLMGWGGRNGYHIAADYLRLGDKRAALDTLRWIIFDEHGLFRTDVYDWRQFAALKEDPEFLELTGRYDTSGWTRERGWKRDLALLREEVVRLNPEYRKAPLPADFVRIYDDLDTRIPNLSDEQIFFEMQRMLATLRQGHVFLYGFRNERFLPLRLYAFPEGLFVIDAPDQPALVGARVVTIGKLSANEALRRVAERQSVDGPMQYLWNGPMGLTQISSLKGMGAIDAVGSVAITFELPNGSARTVTLPSTDVPPKRTQADRPDKILAPPRFSTPLFLSNLAQAHWEKALPKHDALYMQVNNMLDDEDESLEAFGDRMAEVLAQSSPRNLIVDLRNNNGGDTTQYPNLLRTIIAFSRFPGNKVYALIGRRTYSAAGNFVTDLERLAQPIFVGEASSECCFLYGDPGQILLPYSGIRGELTSIVWQLTNPFDRRREMSPDIPAQLTAKEYFAGNDPALEAVFKHIATTAAKP